MSPALRPGGRAIPAIGAKAVAAALRYKIPQRPNPLIRRPKMTISRAHRYKKSYRRNLLF
jgi:hypothetical protein